MDKKKKIIVIIASCLLTLVIIAISLIANYQKKQNLIIQAETVATEKGLKDVEVVILEKSKEYDWYNVAVYCSNIYEFKHSQMKEIRGAISSIDDVFVVHFITNGNTYEVFDDSLYLNGEKTDMFDDSDDIDNPLGEYSLKRGVNGTYTYRCENICDKSCKFCEKSCKKGREDVWPDCTFDYKADSPIGWIGCPLCGTVDNSYWWDWYDEKLSS